MQIRLLLHPCVWGQDLRVCISNKRTGAQTPAANFLLPRPRTASSSWKGLRQYVHHQFSVPKWDAGEAHASNVVSLPANQSRVWNQFVVQEGRSSCQPAGGARRAEPLRAKRCRAAQGGA